MSPAEYVAALTEGRLEGAAMATGACLIAVLLVTAIGRAWSKLHSPEERKWN